MGESGWRQTSDGLRERFATLCDGIEAKEGTLQVFVPGTYSREAVLAQVDALEARYPATAARPPLFGVPVGIKDIFHCAGFITRCGSELPPELFQGPEAATVTRIKRAGAVIMGKTATTEFAYFAPAPTRNPINPGHTPGGSSSGSAAGVAAGFFSYALGTQTVGSIIRPAAYCGIAGLKPSHGRISTTGVVPFSPTADHVGVFSRDISSLAPLLSVLDDRWRPAAPPGDIRLGIPVGPYLAQTETPALSSFHQQVGRLRETGCDIVEVPLFEDIADINHRHTRLIAGEIAREHSSWFARQANRYRRATRELIAAGMVVGKRELEELRGSCPRLRSRLSEIMNRHRLDAWVCPATTGEAPPGLETTGSPLMNLPWTHAGLPTATVPAGNGPGGLPLGLQLAGEFMGDEGLTALAARLEILVVREP